MHDFTTGPQGLQLHSFCFDPFMGQEDSTTGTGVNVQDTHTVRGKTGIETGGGGNETWRIIFKRDGHWSDEQS